MNLAGLSSLFPGKPVISAKYYRIVGAHRIKEIDEIGHTLFYSWRYNPKGEFGVLYLSSTPECAYMEKLKQVYGKPDNLKPQVVGTFSININKCLNLTSVICCKQLGVILEQLIDPYNFYVTQEIAREARNAGFEAIIAPSAVGEDCHSLVVFKDKLNPPSYCICQKASIKHYL